MEGYTSHLQDMSGVDAELASNPFSAAQLSSEQQARYFSIERVVHRHQFHDHDCQTTSCLAMFLWASTEMQEMLREAYLLGIERGRLERDHECLPSPPE